MTTRYVTPTLNTVNLPLKATSLIDTETQGGSFCVTITDENKTSYPQVVCKDAHEALQVAAKILSEAGREKISIPSLTSVEAVIVSEQPPLAEVRINYIAEPEPSGKRAFNRILLLLIIGTLIYISLS